MQTPDTLAKTTLAESIARFLRKILAAIARFLGSVSFEVHADEAPTQAQPAAAQESRQRVNEAANQLSADIDHGHALEANAQLVSLHSLTARENGRLDVRVLAAIGGRMPPVVCPVEMQADSAGRIDRTKVPETVQALLDTLPPWDRARSWGVLCDEVESELASQRLDLDNRIAEELRPAGRSAMQVAMDRHLITQLQRQQPKRGPSHVAS